MAAYTLDDYITTPTSAQMDRRRREQAVPTYTVELDDGMNVVIVRTAGKSTSKLCLLVERGQCFIINARDTRIDITEDSLAAFMKNSADTYMNLENCEWCESLPLQCYDRGWGHALANLTEALSNRTIINLYAAGLCALTPNCSILRFPADTPDVTKDVGLAQHILQKSAEYLSCTTWELVRETRIIPGTHCPDNATKRRCAQIYAWAYQIRCLYSEDAARHAVDVLFDAPDIAHRVLDVPPLRSLDPTILSDVDAGTYIDYVIHGADDQGLSTKSATEWPLNWHITFLEMWYRYLRINRDLDRTCQNPTPDDLIEALSEVSREYERQLDNQPKTQDDPRLYAPFMLHYDDISD